MGRSDGEKVIAQIVRAKSVRIALWTTSTEQVCAHGGEHAAARKALNKKGPAQEAGPSGWNQVRTGNANQIA
jgi:hypothetical protein